MIPLDSTATSPPDSLGGTVSEVPLGAPWPTCDFDADRSIGYTVLVSGFVMLGLALMLLALRLYARFWVLRKWGADDIFMTLAAVLAIVRMNFAVQGLCQVYVCKMRSLTMCRSLQMGDWQAHVRSGFTSFDAWLGRRLFPVSR